MPAFLAGTRLGVARNRAGWGQSMGSRVGEWRVWRGAGRGVGGEWGGSRLQDRDKYRGESGGSALTSLPLFVTAAVFKARNVVPVQRWKNSKQVH